MDRNFTAEEGDIPALATTYLMYKIGKRTNLYKIFERKCSVLQLQSKLVPGAALHHVVYDITTSINFLVNLKCLL